MLTPKVANRHHVVDLRGAVSGERVREPADHRLLSRPDLGDVPWRADLRLRAEQRRFTATAQALNAPVLVYDPTHPFLNGGSLQNVIRKLARCHLSLFARRARFDPGYGDRGEGHQQRCRPRVMTAALDFNISSTPAAPVVDHLAVPVVATVTATPPNLDLRPLALAAVARAAQHRDRRYAARRRTGRQQSESGATRPGDAADWAERVGAA